MINALTNVWLSFIAGLFAPIAAVCVLPLYPGFLAFLANQLRSRTKKTTNKKNILIVLGLITTSGVMTSMMLFGLIFTKLLSASLTNAIGIISPIAFGILGIISILMIFNVDIGKLFPKINSPMTRNPVITSFLFGFFFGAIVLPCNPASLIVLFALSTSTTGFLLNFINFVFFGIGMAMPLLVFAIISSARSTAVIGWLSRNKRKINLIAGILMLAISSYYLIFVFHILG